VLTIALPSLVIKSVRPRSCILSIILNLYNIEIMKFLTKFDVLSMVQQLTEEEGSKSVAEIRALELVANLRNALVLTSSGNVVKTATVKCVSIDIRSRAVSIILAGNGLSLDIVVELNCQDSEPENFKLYFSMKSPSWWLPEHKFTPSVEMPNSGIRRDGSLWGEGGPRLGPGPHNPPMPNYLFFGVPDTHNVGSDQG
jgi:hypothetical protein